MLRGVKARLYFMEGTYGAVEALVMFLMKNVSPTLLIMFSNATIYNCLQCILEGLICIIEVIIAICEAQRARV